MLEDNLRVPSGASYPMIARELCRRSSPSTFGTNHVEDNRDYTDLLRRTMDYSNTGGHTVILTPGRYNAAYFEHSYFAEKTGAHLVTGSELTVENDFLYFVDYSGKKEKVGAVYRRISDEYLDPMTFCEESVIGIPHIFDVYRNYNWQIWETKAFSIYTTTTEMIDRASARQAVEAVLSFLQKQDIIDYRGFEGYVSKVVSTEKMVTVRNRTAGFFEAKVRPGEYVHEGESLACIVDCFEGNIVENICTPKDGTILFAHMEPKVYENTAVYKIIPEEERW